MCNEAVGVQYKGSYYVVVLNPATRLEVKPKAWEISGSNEIESDEKDKFIVRLACCHRSNAVGVDDAG